MYVVIEAVGLLMIEAAGTLQKLLSVDLDGLKIVPAYPQDILGFFWTLLEGPLSGKSGHAQRKRRVPGLKVTTTRATPYVCTMTPMWSCPCSCAK